MPLKRALLLISVLVLAALLRDLVLPREILEDWVDRWLGRQDAVTQQRHDGER